jgi:hypothetical protein
MFRHFIIAAALLFAPVTAYAQDLTGTWVRDGARSDVVPDSMYWTVRGVVTGGTRGATSNHTIEIRQSAGSMQITDQARPLRVYQLDGQQHTVPADTGIVDATIKASVQGDAVVVERSQTYSGLPGSATLNTTEYWTLGADGNSLVLTTIRETPARRVTYNEVYTRQGAPAPAR